MLDLKQCRNGHQSAAAKAVRQCSRIRILRFFHI